MRTVNAPVLLFLASLILATALSLPWPSVLHAQSASAPEDLEERAGLLYKSGESAPFTGFARDFHESGKPRLEATYQGGRLLGSKVWYANGKLAEEVTVSAEQWTIRRFAEDGNLEEDTVAQFTGGRKTAEKSKIWYDNGQLRTEAGFQDGKLDGTLREYSPDGTLLRDEVYDRGKLLKKVK